MLRTSMLITFLVAFAPPAFADEVQKQPEPQAIPAPKKKIEVLEVAPYVPRRDTLEVWQHYGVSPLGRFVPRVIQTEFGPLYSRTLEPYPWIQNRRSSVRP